MSPYCHRSARRSDRSIRRIKIDPPPLAVAIVVPPLVAAAVVVAFPEVCLAPAMSALPRTLARCVCWWPLRLLRHRRLLCSGCRPRSRLAPTPAVLCFYVGITLRAVVQFPPLHGSWGCPHQRRQTLLVSLMSASSRAIMRPVRHKKGNASLTAEQSFR